MAEPYMEDASVDWDRSPVGLEVFSHPTVRYGGAIGFNVSGQRDCFNSITIEEAYDILNKRGKYAPTVFPPGWMMVPSSEAKELKRICELVAELTKCLQSCAAKPEWIDPFAQNNPVTPMDLWTWVNERIEAAEQIPDLGARLVRLKKDRIEFDKLCPGPSQNIAVESHWGPFRRLNAAIDLVQTELLYTALPNQASRETESAVVAAGDDRSDRITVAVYEATVLRGLITRRVSVERFRRALVGEDVVEFNGTLTALAEYLIFLQSKGVGSLNTARFKPNPKNKAGLRSVATAEALKREGRRAKENSLMRPFLDDVLAPIFAQ